MREATDRTTTANLLFRAYSNADLWVDDVAYADGGIVDADTTAPTAPATLSAVDTPPTPAARSTCPGPPPPTTSA